MAADRTRTAMRWFLELFPAHRNLKASEAALRARADGLLESFNGNAESTRIEIARLEARLEELAAERNRYRDELQGWIDKYVGARDSAEQIQKNFADWMALKSGGGITIFDTVQQPPMPAPNFEALNRGPRLARDVVNEMARENFRAALKRQGINPDLASGPSGPVPNQGDDLLAELKAEQEEYVRKNGA